MQRTLPHVDQRRTREDRWRAATIAQLDLKPGDTVIGIGCGTASLAMRMKQQQPASRFIGVDPDPQMLAIARAKAHRAGVQVEFAQAMGDRTVELTSSSPTSVCSAGR